MTLDEFLDDEREILNRFRRFWKNSAKNNPEHFPDEIEMSPGEWDEQLRAYQYPDEE